MRQSPFRLFGLIGYPLSHSFSQQFFSEKFRREGIPNCRYEVFPLRKIEELPRLLQLQPHLEGLNVTIPYKEKVFPFLDELDAGAAKVGAVNVLKIKDGKLTGYNTDFIGFGKSLIDIFFDGDPLPYLPDRPFDALILGTGGSSKAVAYALKTLGIPFQMVSRTPQPGYLTYEDVTPELLTALRIVVNTTPLGTFPNVEECPPLPYDAVNESHLFYDLVYNPEKTLFLKKAEARNARICNGLKMLHLQAERAWEIWNQE